MHVVSDSPVVVADPNSAWQKVLTFDRFTPGLMPLPLSSRRLNAVLLRYRRFTAPCRILLFLDLYRELEHLTGDTPTILKINTAELAAFTGRNWPIRDDRKEKS